MTEPKKPPVNDGASQDSDAAQATAEKSASDAVTDEVEAVRKEAQTNLEGWQRTLAEFQNYKRRTEREQKDAYANAAHDVLKSLLPIIDDLERAMDNLPKEVEAQTWLSGISLIQRKFRKLLEDYNVELIDPVGELFDPNRHQAIGQEASSEHESGHVTETLQKGYVAGDRVLRPAIVKVAE